MKTTKVTKSQLETSIRSIVKAEVKKVIKASDAPENEEKLLGEIEKEIKYSISLLESLFFGEKKRGKEDLLLKELLYNCYTIEELVDKIREIDKNFNPIVKFGRLFR